MCFFFFFFSLKGKGTFKNEHFVFKVFQTWLVPWLYKISGCSAAAEAVAET